MVLQSLGGLVWIMDNNLETPGGFPFRIAEPYHQFHDGFAPGENYPDRGYNDLGAKLSFPDSGCPAGMLGIGVAGL